MEQTVTAQAVAKSAQINPPIQPLFELPAGRQIFAGRLFSSIRIDSAFCAFRQSSSRTTNISTWPVSGSGDPPSFHEIIVSGLIRQDPCLTACESTRLPAGSRDQNAETMAELDEFIVGHLGTIVPTADQ